MKTIQYKGKVIPVSTISWVGGVYSDEISKLVKKERRFLFFSWQRREWSDPVKKFCFHVGLRDGNTIGYTFDSEAEALTERDSIINLIEQS